MKNEYKRYYSFYRSCDWCGQQTRGRVYDDKPDLVFCGSCGNNIDYTSDHFKEKQGV